MEAPDTRAEIQLEASAGYSLGRFFARRWVTSSHGKIRLLRDESLSPTGPLLLVVNGAPSFIHAAAMAATWARPIRFVLPEDTCKGFWPRRLAPRLGIILHGPSKADRKAALVMAREALGRGEAVALFAVTEPSRSEMLSTSCYAVAQLAAKAISGAGSGLTVVPIHALSSYGAEAAGEVLLVVGSPLPARELLGGASSESSLRNLAGALEDQLAQTPFRSEERDLRFFLSDLEKVLLVDLEEEWASKPDWKQRTDGMELSRFMVEFAEDMNARDPAELAGLRLELERYREELRRASLIAAELEAAQGWLASPARRTLYWLEAVLSAPIAFYGFVNHLIPIVLLAPRNLVRRLAGKDPGHAWLLRALVILGTYFLQVSLCARWWGRAAAGYYTLTLPLSGLVFWRFSRLTRSRIRLLILARSLERRRERIRGLRTRFIERLNRVRDRFAEEFRTSS